MICFALFTRLYKISQKLSKRRERRRRAPAFRIQIFSIRTRILFEDRTRSERRRSTADSLLWWLSNWESTSSSESHCRLDHKSLRVPAPPACTNRQRQNSNQNLRLARLALTLLGAECRKILWLLFLGQQRAAEILSRFASLFSSGRPKGIFSLCLDQRKPDSNVVSEIMKQTNMCVRIRERRLLHRGSLNNECVIVSDAVPLGVALIAWRLHSAVTERIAANLDRTHRTHRTRSLHRFRIEGQQFTLLQRRGISEWHA
jgi:hypothetical protein